MSKSIIQKKRILTKAGGGGSLATPVSVANGGTGITSYAIGDIIYASGATTLSKLADVATGSVLISGGVGVAPSWSNSPTVTMITAQAGVFTSGNALGLGTASSLAGKIAFKNATNANTMSIVSGVSTGNFTLTLPVDDGTANQVLQTDGTGVLSWATAGGVAGSTTQVQYNDAGVQAGDADFTWNKTTNVLNTTSGYSIGGTGSYFTTSGGLNVGTRPSMSGLGNVNFGGGASSNITGNYNTALGEFAGGDGITGNSNTFIGRWVGRQVGSVSNTIIIGSLMAYSSAASNCLLIGSEDNVVASIGTVSANDAIIGSGGASGGYKQFYLGQGKTKVSPDSITINVTGGSGADNPGASLTIAGGKGTGSATTGGDIIFQTSDAAASSSTLQTLTTKYTIKKNGVQDYPTTVTAGGTTGNQTINKVSGTVNFAAGATAITVTNSLVSTTSIVFAVVRTDDTTATIKNVVSGSGSFVITLTAAATAETSVGFFTINS